jgi:hypothetical protein
VLEAAAAGTDTNAAASAFGTALEGQGSQSPAAKAAARTAQKIPPASGRKGARELMTTVAKRSSTAKPPSLAQLPVARDSAPLTFEAIEARLVSVIQASESEQRDLIKQRALSVQGFILQSGKVTADRLFIVTPKSTRVPAKGQSRVNLSLD